MSWFKVQNKNDLTVQFVLELQREQNVSRTNVLSLLISSLQALCFPDEYPYEVRPLLDAASRGQLIKNNPLLPYLEKWDDLKFDAESLDFLSHNEIRLHELVDQVVRRVEKIKKLAVEPDYELSHDIHFIVLYKAVLNDSRWVEFLPENLELETGYMYYPDPGEPDPYDDLLKSLGL